METVDSAAKLEQTKQTQLNLARQVCITCPKVAATTTTTADGTAAGKLPTCLVASLQQLVQPPRNANNLPPVNKLKCHALIICIWPRPLTPTDLSLPHFPPSPMPLFAWKLSEQLSTCPEQKYRATFEHFQHCQIMMMIPNQTFKGGTHSTHFSVFMWIPMNCNFVLFFYILFYFNLFLFNLFYFIFFLFNLFCFI